MRQLRAIASAILALGVVILTTYLVANKVEMPVPGKDLTLKVDLLEDECKKVSFIQERITKEIELSKACLVDEDCGAVFLGCPFGCRTVVNTNKIATLQSLADSIPSECSTCVYRCMSGDFSEVCESGVCKNVRLGPHVEPAISVDF